jgi:hypothetical protein
MKRRRRERLNDMDIVGIEKELTQVLSQMNKNMEDLGL